MKLLLLSDIQGNLCALDAVLAQPAAQGADVVLCLGDIASGPEPRKVLERLDGIGARCVLGNMDEVIAAPPRTFGADDEAKRFGEIDRWCSSRLTEVQRKQLSFLPITLELDLPGPLRLLACHGSAQSNEAVISATTPVDEVRAALGEAHVDILLVGHLHEPLLRRVDDLLIVHPGSVGWPKPKLDGCRPPLATFAVLDCDDGNLAVGFHQVRYPLDSLRRDVIESGMPHGEWYLRHWQSP